MAKDFELIATGYLYTPWNGTLRELKGEVYHQDEHRSGYYIVPEKNYFKVIDAHGKVVKKLQCAAHEGEIHNKVVWLRDRDARKAADILIAYEENQIAKLRFQIENHERMIDTLRSI